MVSPETATLEALSDRIRHLAHIDDAEPDRQLALVDRVDLRRGSVTISLSATRLSAELGLVPDELAPSLVRFEARFDLRRRGVETRIVTGATVPVTDPALLHPLAAARGWATAHRAGTSLTELSKRSGRSVPYIRDHLSLAFLSPRLQSAIADGRQPAELTVKRLLRLGIPFDWDDQHRLFGTC
jgi:site-specific DNA recombinase